MINVLLTIGRNESFWNMGEVCLTVQLIFQFKGGIVYYTFPSPPPPFTDRDGSFWMSFKVDLSFLLSID